MTDKITLELTLDELKTLDKHIEYNEETKSVFDKIKYAYPQSKMEFHYSGEIVHVTYNKEDYYRIQYTNGDPRWWVTKDEKLGVRHLINDRETERLLEGLYYNHIEVKKEKEPEDNEWKSVALRFGEELVSVGPCGYYNFTPDEWYDWVVNTYEKLCDDTVKLLKKEKLKKAQKREEPVSFAPKEIEELVRESVKWCEENPDKDPLDWVKPQTPEQVADGLKEAFREAVKQGVVSSTKYPTLEENPDKDPLDWVKPQTPEQVADGLKEAFREAVKQGVVSSIKSPTLYDVCMEWWEDAYNKDCINDLVNKIEAWLPVEQSAAGSQNAYVECTVEGFNDCIAGIKSKLR